MVETLKKIAELIDQNKILEQQNEELRKIIEINLTQNITTNPVSFSEIIDVNEIENLIVKFYKYNRISTAIYDCDSKLLFSVGWKPVCVKYHHCRTGSGNLCQESIRYMNRKISEKPSVFFQCKNGLNAVALPVMVRQEHLATLVLSQFLYEGDPIDWDFFQHQAERFGFNPEKYKEAIKQLPVFTHKEIEQITNNTSYLTELISYSCLKNFETHEKTRKHIESEVVLSALMDKITEQELLLKSLFQNIIHHQEELLEKTVSKTEQNRELKKLNQKIDRTETILNSLLTSLPLGICFVRKGVFTYVNDQMFKISGYTSKELIGRDPEFLFGSESGYRDLFQRLPESDFLRNDHSIELSLETRDHQTLDIISFSSLINKDHPEQGWTVSILDITAMKEVQKELMLSKEKAEEADRLKNAFLTNMSHELRTPMNAIIGFTGLLSSGKIYERKRKEYSQIIAQSGKKLLRLIDDIIDVSKIETNQMEISRHIFQLHPLLTELKNIFTEYINQKCGTGVLLTLTEPVTFAAEQLYNDDIRLKQVFCNLISNAIKFTEKGSIDFGYTVSNETVEFYVRDTGLGIIKSQLPHIFDHFRQVDNSYTREHGGAGIGLTIAKNLVELMGGHIRVESKFGKGSCFYFSLPGMKQQPLAKNLEKEFNLFDLQYDWSQKTILIAEDEEVNFLFLQNLLMPTNINIRWAQNGQKAIDCVNQFPDIDLVLMDIKMPVMNGLDATRIIKSKQNSLPVIAQTAYAHGHNKDDFIRAGCDEYIPKPINSKQFISMLGKFLDPGYTEQLKQKN